MDADALASDMIDSRLQTLEVGLVDGAGQLVGDETLHAGVDAERVHASRGKSLDALSVPES
jgi:hypothetical protein